MESLDLSVKQIKLLNRHRYILQKLATSKSKDRKIILKNAPIDLFKALNLVFKLLANEQFKLSKRQSNKLRKHRRLIRSTSELNNKDIKDKLVHQKGGALPAILSAILPIIGGIVKSIL